MSSGFVKDNNGKLLTDGSLKSFYGQKINIKVPKPDPMEALAEPIILDIIYEDYDLLVINKPAGMVVHPAPGSKCGTLVNALLHHCGENLSGIGGVRRPGIVHRIDKGTSGLLVVAKTDLSHRKLSEQFSAHSIERKYSALIYGNPDIESLRLRGLIGISFEEKRVIKISGKIARHKYDRKKMTVNNSLGRRAVTRIKEEKIFGSKEKPFATLLDCWLETGRTHQIRAHLNYLGFGLIGDLVYSSRTGSKKNINKEIFESVKNFNRPALHARELGFIHPRTGELLNFKSDLPTDMEQLLHKFYEIS